MKRLKNLFKKQEEKKVIQNTQKRLEKQKNDILTELEDAKGNWVSVFRLRACSHAMNHTARISELRKLGYNVEWNGDKNNSKYRLNG